jgi:O-antigen/teichoic acid export membrane protein
VILGIAGPELFRIIFGANWVEAGRYAQILSPWMFILFISSPLSNLFSTLERQELALIVNSVILGTRFVALIIGGLTHNIYLTLIIWSASGVLVYGGLALWLLKLTQVSWAIAFQNVFQYVLYAAIPALILVLVKIPLTPFPVWLLTSTVLVTLAYYALVLVKDRSLRDYIFALLPQRSAHQG